MAGGGDQAANAVGVGAVVPGRVALSLGTSGVVFATTDSPLFEPAGRVHAFCHAVPGRWHMMSVMLSAAGSLRWFRDAVAPGVAFGELVDEASQAPAGSDGLLFLPYLSGERSPHPDPLARGAFVGLTLAHDRRHLARAVLEGVAFGLRDGLDLMTAAGMPAPAQIRASGGGTASALWRQILADVLEAEIATVSTTEGAAYGAGAAGGASARAGSRRSRRPPTPWSSRRRRPRPGPTRPRYAELHARYRELYPALAPSSRFAARRRTAGPQAGASPSLRRGARPASVSVTSPGFLPMMIIARTSSLVTSSLFTVPTSLPWSMTVIRSDRSNTSWMSWLIRKIPMPSSLSWRDQLADLGGLGRARGPPWARP